MSEHKIVQYRSIASIMIDLYPNNDGTTVTVQPTLKLLTAVRSGIMKISSTRPYNHGRNKLDIMTDKT